eukprot:jgi/Hompol1/5926/HPOL_002129-RA
MLADLLVRTADLLLGIDSSNPTNSLEPSPAAVHPDISPLWKSLRDVVMEANDADYTRRKVIVEWYLDCRVKAVARYEAGKSRRESGRNLSGTRSSDSSQSLKPKL